MLAIQTETASSLFMKIPILEKYYGFTVHVNQILLVPEKL